MPGPPRPDRARPPTEPPRLTPSETGVLALLPTHLTLAAIGDRLGIGRPTVKTHVQRIYEKLGATNRADAVESAENAGLLPVTRPAADDPTSTKRRATGADAPRAAELPGASSAAQTDPRRHRTSPS